MTPNPRRVSLDCWVPTSQAGHDAQCAGRGRGSSSRTTTGFSHGDNSPTDYIDVELDEAECGEHEMRVRPPTRGRHQREPVAPGYVNTVTHWWTDRRYTARRKSAAEICAPRWRQDDRRGRPAAQRGQPALDGVDKTGFADNYWIGLSMLHTCS